MGRDLNIEGKPGINKMKMFPRVMNNLNKGELRLAFVEANLLSVMTDWLAPMPDKGLPHVNMRTAFLKLLQELRIEEPSRLKESGIGKAVMYLYRHPRETRKNKFMAGYIINKCGSRRCQTHWDWGRWTNFLEKETKAILL